MRILFIEDEPELHDALRAELDDHGIELVIAANTEQAIALLDDGGFDLFVCDLKIPASKAAPEAHKDHGIRVYDQIRVQTPGVPVIIFSAYGELADLGDRLSEAEPRDLYGAGTEKIAMSRKKSELVEVVALIVRHAAGLESLRGVEISGAAARAAMTLLDARLIALYARRHGGSSAKARLLAGGKSGALTVRVEVEKVDGTSAGRIVAKLNDLSEIYDEERRYEKFVAPILDAATYTNRLETIKAGAQHRGALIYSLAGRYEASLFDVTRRDATAAATIVTELREYLDPWHGQGVVSEMSIGDVRRLLLRDERLPELLADVPWANKDLESQVISTRRATVHGDFHGGNVLVTADYRPIVIDFGRVGVGVNSMDPVALELSFILHPDAQLNLGDWPTTEQAEHWEDRQAYLEGCPIRPIIEVCRDWSDGVSRGDRETDATVYAFGLRQLRFDDVDLNVAAALSRGAAARLQKELGS